MNGRLLLWIAGLTFLFWAPFIAATSPNPHEIFELPTVDFCLGCHRDSPPAYAGAIRHSIQPDEAGYQMDGSAMCTVCHRGQPMHMVGKEIDFPVPKDLPLDQGKKIQCLTCHYTHGRLTSDRPWAAVSFMDRLIRSEHLYKSYLLRRNNSGGELCLVCHNTEDKTK